MINIVLLGPPGCGKGTQASLMCQKLSICHISTGELLRQEILQNTPLGIEIKQTINSGLLVPDHIVIQLVLNLINSESCKRGVLLDGFPRTLSQTKLLQQHHIHLGCVIYLAVSDEIIIDRLVGRRYHPGSGRIYHVTSNRPKIAGIDDLTGEPLVTRADDEASIIQHRLSIYHQNTKEIINWYQQVSPNNFFTIDGSLDPQDIFNQIMKVISMVFHLD